MSRRTITTCAIFVFTVASSLAFVAGALARGAIGRTWEPRLTLGNASCGRWMAQFGEWPESARWVQVGGELTRLAEGERQMSNVWWCSTADRFWFVDEFGSTRKWKDWPE